MYFMFKKMFENVERSIEKNKEASEKRQALKRMLFNPENCIFTAYFKDDEIVIKVREKNSDLDE